MPSSTVKIAGSWIALALVLIVGVAVNLGSLPVQAQSAISDPNEPGDLEPASEPVSEPAAAVIPDSPGEDYQASEQISEDLSVSFPVDI